MKLLLILFIVVNLFALDNRLIPLYSYPTYWNYKALKNTSIIVNPNNGPGLKKDIIFEKAINRLRKQHTRVFGYVYTSYGKRNIFLIEQDIANWAMFYNVNGIFLDEASTDLHYLKKYIKIAKFIRGIGLKCVALNAGTNTQQAYIDSKKFNIIVIFENNASTIQNYHKLNLKNNITKLATLVYGYKGQNLKKFSSFNYVYVTKKNANPWDSLSYIKPKLKSQTYYLKQ